LNASSNAGNPTNSNTLQATFLSLLPKIQNHAQITFRAIQCSDTKADKICETIALAWRYFQRLHEQGRDISRFTMVFTYTVVRAVKSGRRLCGQEKARDVLSPTAQQRHRFKVAFLPGSTAASHQNLYAVPHGQHKHDALEEMLHDDGRTPVPDQAAFRIDFPAWCQTLGERDRRLVYALMIGERTQDVAGQFGLSPGRISQKRRQFHQDWHQFTSDSKSCCPRPSTDSV
jgi:hypothetical protein